MHSNINTFLYLQAKCGVGLTFRVDENNEYRVVDKDASMSAVSTSKSTSFTCDLLRFPRARTAYMGSLFLCLVVYIGAAVPVSPNVHLGCASPFP